MQKLIIVFAVGMLSSERQWKLDWNSAPLSVSITSTLKGSLSDDLVHEADG